MKKKKKDYYEDENYEINDIEIIDKENSTSKKIVNVIFILIIALGIMIAADIVCVAKYNKGPYFAIRTNTYNDGGTEVFYGLGYKVIKYHQKQGRRDTQIGFWNMKYQTTPTDINAIDLAIEFRNNPKKTANKLAKKFVRLTGEIYKIKDKELILQYKDPTDAYTLRIKCKMADEEDFSNLQEKMEITVIGTIENFTIATKTTPNKVNMSNCFAE